MVDRGSPDLDGQLDARALLELARVQTGTRPAAIPACRMALASSTSKAPLSQNTSIHRASGAHAPASGRRPGRRSRCGRRGTREARRERRGTSSPGVNSRATRRARGLVGDGQAVAALGLEGRDAAADAARRPTPDAAAQRRVVGGSGRRDGRGDAARRIGLPAHPRRELRRALPCEHQVGVAVHESGCHADAPEIDAAVGVRRVRAAPTHAMRSPSTTSAASVDDAERALVALARIVGDEFADAR